MLISIDYDNTWSKDPALWRDFIVRAHRSNHRVICITNKAFPNNETTKLNEFIPVFYAGDCYKQQYAIQIGYNVDVWIDDMPGTICKSVELP